MVRVISESRLRARRRKRFLIRSILVSVGFVLFIGGLVALLWAPFWRVQQVNVSGADDISPAIQQFAQQELAGHFFLLFPKNNILLYPKQGIEQGLLATYPTLASVSVQGESLKAIDIRVVEHQPTAQWCTFSAMAMQDESTSTVPSACWYMDQNGLVYMSAPMGDKNGLVTFTSSSSPSTLPWQFLTPVQFQSLSALVASILKEKVQNDSLLSVEIDENNDVHLQFADGFVLLFSLEDASGDIYNRLSLALTADVFANHPLSDFEYLDLRFGDKLYYKLKSS
jgi:hypothetical protein